MTTSTDSINQIVDIAGVKKDISYIKDSITKIESGIKELSGVYLTKLEADDVFRALQERLNRLEKTSNLWRWLSPTLATVLGAIVTFLTISYLKGGRI